MLDTVSNIPFHLRRWYYVIILLSDLLLNGKKKLAARQIPDPARQILCCDWSKTGFKTGLALNHPFSNNTRRGLDLQIQ